MAYWGIDLGGTKIEGVVMKSPDNPDPVARIRIPTESAKGYAHILSRISDLVEKMKAETGLTPDKIGIGAPGSLDPYTQTLKNSNTVCLNGQPFKRDIEQTLGLPVIMANDANCFALAETRLGAVAKTMPNAEVVFGVILGTGVGGGLIVHKSVINGRHGIAGEWGHNFLDQSGGKCYCGRAGCVETVISGPALEKHYEELTAQRLSLQQIVERHEQKTDANATMVVKRLCHFFGKAVAAVINIADPDAVVLGGGVGNIDLLYSEGVAEAGKFVFNNRLDTRFLKPVLGDSAGVFGAAMLTV